MIGFNLFKASPLVLGKIDFLCRLLWQSKIAYERAAEDMPDKELRCTILTLAQGRNQYANELFSQIQSLGGALPTGKRNGPEYLSQELPILRNEKEVLAFCNANENKMVKAYRATLGDSSLYDGLRKMILYQLNGALCSVMQLRLLRSLRFHFPIIEHGM
ncbi:MAG TPA: hypothetical protein VNV85_03625 [Puia sp.]|nr:hypothetical protein [Puia sp.]